VVNCLVLHGIITSGGKAKTLSEMNQLKKECDTNFRGDGFFNNNFNERKAKQIQMFMLEFYENLQKRPAMVRRSQLVEETKLSNAKDQNQVLLVAAQLANKVCEDDIDSNVSSDSDDSDEDNDDFFDQIEGINPATTHTAAEDKTISLPNASKIKKRNAILVKSKSTPIENTNESVVERKTVMLKDLNSDCLPSLMKVGKKKQKNNDHNITCWRIVNLIFEVFKHSWLRCRHLGVLMTHFFQGHIKRTKYFGSYRVELVVLLFHRLTDVQNFDVISKHLMASELACLYCRLGYLKLFNPLKPEGVHFLNIGNREERIITKMMGTLSVQEPGENWINETFQWELEVDPIPGWYVLFVHYNFSDVYMGMMYGIVSLCVDTHHLLLNSFFHLIVYFCLFCRVLTQTWMTDEGMPPRGFLYVQYYSGEGKKLLGTRPNIAVRKSLLHMVTINSLQCID
jgi:hypothetical protein